MADLIDRQQAIDAVRKALSEYNGEYDCRSRYGVIADSIVNLRILPSVQPERKKGKWVYDNGLKQFFCDQCSEPSLTYDDIYIYSMDFTNFCPNCGADMRGEENETD